MFQSVKGFTQGLKFHVRGIRFGFSHLPFLMLSVLPFLFTLTLYVLAFYVFTEHSEDILRTLWKIEPGESPKYMGWLYWVYIHGVKFFLYLILLVVMFYTFIVFSNIVASPVYELITTKYQRLCWRASPSEPEAARARGTLTVVKEELKKAAFMLLIPLPLLFIPIVGSVLSFLFAALFIAWDYIDFSLSKDCPLLKDRIKAIRRHKALLLGFGCPLLIPFFGLLFMPFAILGATTLYFNAMKESPQCQGHPSP